MKIKQIIEIEESDYELSCQRYGDARYNGYQPGYENTAIAQSTPYNPSGDLISKNEVKKLGATCLARRNEGGQLEAIISLDLAPTVEARPTGEWLFKHNSSDIWCSVCDENFDEIPQAFNFCPNCGADMRSKGDANNGKIDK